MKNILVVGGGVVGITAAYFAKQKDTNVVLIEADNELGGLLKSDCNDYGCFDYGTHVASKTGVDELDSFLFSDFTDKNSYKFNVAKSGNFFNNKLSDISPYANINHLSKEIYRQGCEELLNSNNKVSNNLEETLINRYGNTVYQSIFKGLIDKFFGCSADKLANECLYFFDMNRVLSFDEEKTNQLKKENANLDSKIGFHFPTKGVDKIYPKVGGMGRWVKNLEKKLIHNKIAIKKQTQVTNIEVKNDKFLVTMNGEIFEIDELVWALSSGLLNRFIPTDTIGNRPNFRKTAIYDFVFDKPLKTDSCYINVYDTQLLSSRITCYQNLQQDKFFYACTVEVLNDDDFSFKQATSKIQKELSSIGLVMDDAQCIFSQCRILKQGFPTLTNNDVENLTNINKYYQRTHKNITLLGRGSAKGFFMSELLTSAYREMKK
jgi:protoporphyrinogen oxidase